MGKTQASFEEAESKQKAEVANSWQWSEQQCPNYQFSDDDRMFDLAMKVRVCMCAECVCMRARVYTLRMRDCFYHDVLSCTKLYIDLLVKHRPLSLTQIWKKKRDGQTLRCSQHLARICTKVEKLSGTTQNMRMQTQWSER